MTNETTLNLFTGEQPEEAIPVNLSNLTTIEDIDAGVFIELFDENKEPELLDSPSIQLQVVTQDNPDDEHNVANSNNNGTSEAKALPALNINGVLYAVEIDDETGVVSLPEDMIDNININIEPEITITPQPKARGNRNVVMWWFKRKLMWWKRWYKRYKVWRHKLGKFHLDPDIRSQFREQRKIANSALKQVDVLLAELDKYASKFEDNEKIVNEALTTLQDKTRMMR